LDREKKGDLLHGSVGGTVESMIRGLPNSLGPWGRIHGRTQGCKWSLLKVREEKYKMEHGGA
jgi:hypothetical protein